MGTSQIEKVKRAYRSGARTTREVSDLTGLSVQHASSHTCYLVKQGLLNDLGPQKPEGLRTNFHFYEPTELLMGKCLPPWVLRIARLTVKGHTNKETAAKLGISADTVWEGLDVAYRHLGIHGQWGTPRNRLVHALVEYDREKQCQNCG